MRIAFVGNLFHRKTRSSQFFLTLLQQRYTVDDYWGLPRNNLKEINKKALFETDYDAVVIWQVKFSPEELAYSRCRNVIIVPMYDEVVHFGDDYWKRLAPYRFINFSKHLHDRLSALGLPSLSLQYATAPQTPTPLATPCRLFFWQRRDEISWTTLKQLIDPSQVASVHIHCSVDPGITFDAPDADDVARFAITFSDWFETKEAYLEHVAACDVFVAPRVYEGIGMAFIEAMARGKCVIAPDRPTMNEYIRDGHNGLLFDPDAPRRVDLSEVAQLGAEAHETITRIRTRWEADAERIFTFIETPVQTQRVVPNAYTTMMDALERLCDVSLVRAPREKYRRYKAMLQTYHAVKEALQPIPASAPAYRKKLLLFFPHNPFLLQNGVQTRFHALLHYFKARNVRIDLLSHSGFVDAWSEEHRHHPLVHAVYLNDFQKSKERRPDAALPDFAFPALKQQFDALIAEHDYDGVIMSYVHWARLIDGVKLPTYLMIEDFIALNTYERQEGDYDLGRGINEEIARIRRFDHAVCISQDEMLFFERVCKGVRFHHVPHFIDAPPHKSVAKTVDLLFVGSDNPFNHQGMRWFLDAVIPHLNKHLRITVAGGVNKHLKADHERFGQITFIDYADDLDTLYASSRLSICPLQGGTGLKIKVVESMAYGVPVVTTRYGTVGIDGSGCAVADDPREFADAAMALLKDGTQYAALQRDALAYFAKHFAKKSVYAKLDRVFLD